MSDNIKKFATRFIIKPLSNSRGFTLVELNTAITISAILSASFLVIFTSFLVSITKTNASIELTSTSQVLLRSIVEEIRYGGAIQQTNQLTDNDPTFSPGNWNTSNPDTLLITSSPALNSSNNFIIDPGTNKPYYNEYIYYRQGPILYKKTLANPAAAGNKSKSSCFVATGSCPVADRQLINTLDTMNVTFYKNDGSFVGAALQARSVKIDLNLKRQVIGETIKFNNSSRITLRNEI